MKTLPKRLILTLYLIAVYSLVNAEIPLIINDSFNRSSVDNTQWSSATPYSDSSVVCNGSTVSLKNHGVLISKSTLPNSFEIRGRFRFSGSSYDSFNILFRHDGVMASNGGFSGGVSVQFQIRSGDQGTVGQNNIKIIGAAPTEITSSYSLAMNKYYDFRITDDGNRITVYLNDLNSVIVTATTTARVGNKLVLQNREGLGHGSSISDNSITEIDYFTVGGMIWDYVNGYKHINDTNAETNLTGQVNVKKYSEWQSPPVTYWGPTANNVDAVLTYRYTMPENIGIASLKASTASFNFSSGGGLGSGQSSLWGSKDGNEWVLLMDNPTPQGTSSYKDYNEFLPNSILGSKSLWVQYRAKVNGAPNTTYTVAQLSRSDQNAERNVFEVNLRMETAKPVIAQSPLTQNVNVGQSHALTVQATGAAPLSYQWWKNGVSISGATNNTLTINSFQLTDAGDYYVQVNNNLGSTISGVATLTALTVPSITKQPESVKFYPGQSINLSVNASGIPSPIYQWRKDGVPISGKTDPMLTISNAQPAHVGDYTVIVSNGVGSAISNSVEVRMVESLPSFWRGMVAYYNFEDETVDQSGYGNHSSPSGRYQYVSGVTGKALRTIGDNSIFYSGGGYVQLPKFGEYMNSGFSFSLWVKDESMGGSAFNEEAYISYGALNLPLAEISVNTQTHTITYCMRKDSTNDNLYRLTQSITPSSYTSWKHLVLTYTPGKIVAYFNGKIVGELTGTINTFPLSNSAIGRHWWDGGASSSARMTASYDNVRIYSRALTGKEVEELYEKDGPGTKPVIISQPLDNTVNIGNPITFTVVASGTDPLSYQWFFNGTPIAGATNTSYTIGNVTNSNSGSYSVRISNSVGEITSNSVSLKTATVPILNPMITGRSVNEGETARFDAVAVGTMPFSYQWYRNGIAIAGATNSEYAIDKTTETHAGNYTVKVTNIAGSVTSDPITLKVLFSRIANLSVRSTIGTISEAFIVGFVIEGVTPKPLLLRGIGPSLNTFGVDNPIADTMFTLYSGVSPLVTNDDWGNIGADADEIATISRNLGAFDLARNSRDSVIYRQTNQGVYTAQLNGKEGMTGIALIELYDANTSNGTRVTNISARTKVGTGVETLIAGFVLQGNSPKKLLIRGIGPTLANYGVSGYLVDPKIELHKLGNSTPVASNDNWGTSINPSVIIATSARIGAFPLDLASKDAVLLQDLDPGIYTVQIAGVNNATGVALVEIFEAQK